ncbi:MAG: hypothetical protein JSU77_11200 [Fidelibacterota bacterium]|nr:MAG: hypothetical protein JSU77_11200 [Candidatus Neomarinimicrobiota bacterium]
MIDKVRLNPFAYEMGFRGDVFITLLNGIGVIAGVLVLYGLIARFMGVEALGEFLLVRRITFPLMGILLVGMTTGLPYYVSRLGDNAYGSAALLLFGLLTLPLISLASVALHYGVLSGFPHTLALPFFIFAVGYALQFLVYGLFRGHLNILGANLLQLIGTGLIPVGLFFLLYRRGIPSLLMAFGLGTLILSGLAGIIKLRDGWSGVDGRKIAQLLVYGVQRVPSSLAFFILLGGVPLLILSSTSKAEIAFVNSGISLIRLFMVVVGPLGVVLLPRLSKALAADQKARIIDGLEALVKTTFLVGVTLAIFLSINSEALMRVWLGSESTAGADIVALIVLALPFYLLMAVLRAPIDAASVRGYNSLIYGAAALALLTIFYGLKLAGVDSTVAGAISFIGGHMTGSVASLYYTYKFYGINITSPWYLMTVLGMVTFSIILVCSINALVSGLLSLLLGGITLLLALGLLFMKSRSAWIVDFRSLVTTR